MGWTSIATVSSRKDTETYPFVNIISFSDGPLGNGTGIPYMFLTPLDFTAQDVFKDDRATLMMTLAQGRYCESKNYDPMDPRCARVVFSGKIKEVKENNPEYPIAKSAIFGRHPWLAHMPKDHHFFFAKLKIGTIAVLDTFGGPKYVTLDDYLQPPKSDR
ncbi:protein CREG1-like [Copidosoma floridanum]|uniref:protein CREG1-like n=1 Tax=Copidosoma floridanum TaxID=29053 RepID=UPI0006C994E6|nr:protein CREG1-like [Copidosoma floridanum]